jgi:hypothetical protein
MKLYVYNFFISFGWVNWFKAKCGSLIEPLVVGYLTRLWLSFEQNKFLEKWV